MDSQKRELVSVRIPKELNKKLTEYVAEIGISKAAFILQLIYRELKNEQAYVPPTTQTEDRNEAGR